MEEESVIRLRRVVLRLARQLNAASVGEGLTPTQASVLGIVTNRGRVQLPREPQDDPPQADDALFLHACCPPSHSRRVPVQSSQSGGRV